MYRDQIWPHIRDMTLTVELNGSDPVLLSVSQRATLVGRLVQRVPLNAIL
jgi:hypothetical protein